MPPPVVPPERVARERPVRRGFAAVVERFAVERFAPGLRVVVDWLAPDVADLARVEVDFFAVLRLAALRFVVERLAVDRFAVDLRAPPLREDRADDPELALALPSIVHLPDITRCAASATASAMIEPSLVALDMTLVAACEAVSAASRPASRILRRAAGLALIAAAAAARPAASISLLIAAFASLSTVSLPEDFDEAEDLEEVFLADLAIALSPSRCREYRFSPVTVPI